MSLLKSVFAIAILLGLAFSSVFSYGLDKKVISSKNEKT